MRYLSRWASVVTLASLLFTVSAKQTLAASPRSPGEAEIPFNLTAHNNIVVKTRLNDKDTLKLMLHTAARDVTLTEDATRKSKSIQWTGRNKVESWGGESDARFSKANRVQMGYLKRSNITVWEDKNSGKDTDGKFGLDFFSNQIVEINFDRRRIVLHKILPRKAETYERLQMENQDGELLVQGTCLIDGKTYSNKFLLHSGYSGGILLDDEFAANAGIDGKIKITEEASLKDSFGNTLQVKKGILPVFALGGSQISNVPVGFFAGSLGTQKISIIGSEILIKFNLIFDLAHRHLYIAPRRIERKTS